MNRDRNRNIAKIAAPTMSITTKLTALVRSVTMRSGSNGCRVRASITKKAITSSAPAMIGPRVRDSVQLAGLPVSGSTWALWLKP